MESTPYFVELIETALTGAFSYHQDLDNFFLTSGISKEKIDKARQSAEAKNIRYQRAPKRLIVQEIIQDIMSVPSRINTLQVLSKNICQSILPDATPEARQAIDNLRFHNADNSRKACEMAQQLRNVLEKEREYKRKERKSFQLELANLHDYKGTPQERGYKLENLLERFLNFEGLKPRKSFRVTGEQIDGSFLWNGSTYFVEAKWQDQQTSGAEFGAFQWKIEGKSIATRGLFISINGYSQSAIQALNNKGELRFVCIDGAHLFQAMNENDTLINVMETAWRYASETGQAFLPIGSKVFNERHNLARP